MTKLGQEIIDYKILADNGKEYSLTNFRGQKLIIYFYPKDNTPGCTIEACDFTSLHNAYISAGYKILGISRDSIQSHKKFKQDHNLNLLLLSGPDLMLHKAFGSWGEKMMYGKLIKGVIRSTFILNEQLEITGEFRNVRAKGHAERVLKTL